MNDFDDFDDVANEQSEILFEQSGTVMRPSTEKATQKPAKKLYQYWWFWLIILPLFISSFSSFSFSADSPEPFSVQVFLKPQVEPSSGLIYFDITTNLPSNTKLIVTVRDENEYVLGQDKVIVTPNGTAATSAFSNNGQGLKGNVFVCVTTSLACLQDTSVQRVIGEHGEYMEGKYVVVDGDEHFLDATFSLSFNNID